jgi:sugar porter (SP) family MFS transporter
MLWTRPERTRFPATSSPCSKLVRSSVPSAVRRLVVRDLVVCIVHDALTITSHAAKYGRKYTLLAFSVIFVVGAILTTVASADNIGRGLAEIYVGRTISGIGIGAISAVAPAFVSECSPKEVRGRITGMFQIMVATGVMVSYFVNCAPSPLSSFLFLLLIHNIDGVAAHIHNSEDVWRIPFGVQLVPIGVMALGILTIKESPRFLASVNKRDVALVNLAYLRREPVTSESVISELAEIEAAIDEERAARQGLGLKEAFFGKGNFIRFVIAFVIFLLQQWSGQNSVNYYAPQIFQSVSYGFISLVCSNTNVTQIGYTGQTNSLLASGIYGIVKLVATAIFIFFGVETLGRKLSFLISSFGMGTLFFIIGALLKTFPPPIPKAGEFIEPPPASKGMAALLYIYVCFYSMGWGPLPWVYVSDIFPTRTRHYGLALASASQWLFSECSAFVYSSL